MLGNNGQADVIEVTEEMISAGLREIYGDAEFHPAADEAEVVARLFRAMVMVRSFQGSLDSQYEQ